jgi:ligand-binding SRPBCC domain-containing protein
MYTLFREQIIPTSLDKAWRFVSNPKNLNQITPEDMEFKIISEVPDEMYDGLLIEYLVKIPSFGKRKWVTEIKHIRLHKSFVDEQRIGPYNFWYHYHEIQEAELGVKIIDRVSYELPYWILGKIMHSLLIRKILNRIFDYRKEMFGKLL